LGTVWSSEEIDKQHPDPAAAGGPGRTRYPDECYLPVHGQYYGMIMSTRVIDFSNPLTVKLERERAFQWVAAREETGRAEMILPLVG